MAATTDYRRLGQMKGLIIDMDGVLYHGKRVLPGAPDLFRFLERNGISYVLATNNSSATQRQYCERLAGLSIIVPECRIVTSGQATAAYLKEHAPAGARVYLIGEPALFEVMSAADINITDEDPDYVVVGIDRHFTYAKLEKACMALSNGAKFVATNPDTSLPTERGLVPGNGALLAAITCGSGGVQPTVIGKPEVHLVNIAMRMFGLPREVVAMLGDRLDTDTLAGLRAGVLTLLVLSGISSRDDIAATSIVPELVFRDLPELLAAWGDSIGSAQ